MIDSGYIGPIALFDILVAFVVLVMVILGISQGAIRRLLGIGAILFSFLVAANLRDPLGAFFAGNWTHLPTAYTYMIAFGVLFLVLALGFALASQLFYRKVVVFERYPAVDPAIGAILGGAQAVLLVAITIVLLDSYFRFAGVRQPNELPLLREIFVALDPSWTAGVFRTNLIPVFLAVAGPLIPTAISQAYPRA